ncbi:alpha/beta hydrolase fold domain-containing protein [Corynebacterium yudongzhengii]|nr:alpha/beta hydrolase fold domain-containing protein [Corynebacterium yudongzhengii]
MGADSFHVGGVRRTLPPEKQLEQLLSYMEAHYELPDFAPPWKGGSGDPGPADRYVGKLPDRITHAAMLMLGSAVDHAMPGVAYGRGVDTEEVPELNGLIMRPPNPSGKWVISLHSGGWWRGAGEALEFQWRPEVAAAAALSNTTILDLDHPLAPAASLAEIDATVARALDWARSQGAKHVTAWGYSSGGALAAMQAARADALVLTFPDLASVDNLPADIRGEISVPEPDTWPKTLVQIATQDEIAARPEGIDDHSVSEYLSTHRISTPEVARERIRDVAEFLREL